MGETSRIDQQDKPTGQTEQTRIVHLAYLVFTRQTHLTAIETGQFCNTCDVFKSYMSFSIFQIIHCHTFTFSHPHLQQQCCSENAPVLPLTQSPAWQKGNTSATSQRGRKILYLMLEMMILLGWRWSGKPSSNFSDFSFSFSRIFFSKSFLSPNLNPWLTGSPFLT